MTLGTQRAGLAEKHLLALALTALLPITAGCRSAPPNDPGGSRSGDRTPPTSGECREVITADAARQIFQQLSGLHGSDRCVLRGLSTEHSIMRSTWTRDGASLPELTVTPATCTSRQAQRNGRYAIVAGDAFAAACPDTFTALRDTFSHAAPAPTVPALVRGHGPNRLGGHRVRLGAILLLGIGAAVWWRRTRARSDQTSRRLNG